MPCRRGGLQIHSLVSSLDSLAVSIMRTFKIISVVKATVFVSNQWKDLGPQQPSLKHFLLFRHGAHNCSSMAKAIGGLSQVHVISTVNPSVNQ
jgi:hypothetical protein